MTDNKTSGKDDISSLLLDEKTLILQGWPGHRHLPGKSGLGYLDTVAEEAHMEGLFLRWIFTGQFRTHNPIFLLALFLFGMFTGGIPLILLAMALLEGDFQVLFVLIVGAPYIAIGVGLIVNVALSIFQPHSKSVTGD